MKQKSSSKFCWLTTHKVDNNKTNKAKASRFCSSASHHSGGGGGEMKENEKKKGKIYSKKKEEKKKPQIKQRERERGESKILFLGE